MSATARPRIHAPGHRGPPIFGRLRPYAIAAGAIAVAIAARWLLSGLLGVHALYFTVLPAVLLVAIGTRLAPAIFALVLGWLAVALLFWPPWMQIELSRSHVMASAAYLLVGAVSLLIVQLLRNRDAAREGASYAWRTHATEDLLDSSARLQDLLASLSLSEERYRVLAEALPQFVWTETPDGEIDYCNQYWLDYSGLTIRNTPKRWPGLIHPDDRDHVMEIWRRAHHRQQDVQVEYRVRRASDGQYRWYLGRVSPILDAQRQLVKWVGSAIDIDDQKRAQNALMQQQEHFRLLAEAIPQIVWTADERGRVDYFNRRWFDYTEMSQEQTFAEEGWLQAMHPEDLPRFRQLWDQSLQTGQEFQIEYRFCRASDNAYRWHLGRAVPLSVGDGVAHWFGTCTDIEDQKRAEMAVRESEERFRMMADTAPVMIWMAGPDQRGYWFNKPWLEFTGRSLEQETGKGWMASIHPAERQSVADTFTSAYAQQRTFTIEFRLRHRDGRYHWVLDTGVPRFRADGEMLGFIGSVIDIHDRKQAEQERDQLLESERAARSEAERASRMKDEFLATLSHELRTPLNAVLGYAQLLRRASDDPEVLQQGLETIERSAKAQAQLISDMLDVSRIISGKIRLDVRPIRIEPVVEAAIETVQPAASSRQIQVVRHITEELPVITGDPERLQQVLWNMLSNAVKFTPPGGLVTVSLQRVGTSLEISVSDTGQGIPVEFLPYVFERFRQADGSSTRRHGGLGLGLSIVKNLTELHGGTVRAYSEGEGLGATFTVSLPVAPVTLGVPVTVGDQSQVDDGLPNLKGVDILAVDDEPDALTLLRRLLEPCDCRVRTATSAAEALQMIERTTPDLLISDIGMPVEDGYSLIRKVRQLRPEAGRNVPAIALTAFARAEDRARAIRAGYQAHVAKPIEAPVLLTAISQLARSSRTEGIS